MHGNAVFAIYPGKLFRFELIDALGNIWYSGENIPELCAKIREIYHFTKSSIRIRCKRYDLQNIVFNDDIEEFIGLNNELSEYIQTSCGTRFFGNLSTRCQKLFPTCKSEFGIFVSPRNIAKDKLAGRDMVHARLSYGEDMNVLYSGTNKPSVDTPTQLMIYENFPNINYMIHGHAFVKDCETTANYFPCGDLREYDEVSVVIKDKKSGNMNLKNHGFLLWGETLASIKELIKSHEFHYER